MSADQQRSGAVIVVKCGGSDALARGAIAADIAHLRSCGEKIVFVHGGSADILRLACQLGVPVRTAVSPSGLESRCTDVAMCDVVVMALAGRTKPRWTRLLQHAGVPAVGLTGLDGGLVSAARKGAWRAVEGGRTRIVRDDLSGRIVSVDPTVIRTLMAAGFTPVVSPPAAGEDWAPLNVDADRLAAAVAVELAADHLILLTDVAGVLRNPPDDTTMMSSCILPRTGPADVALGRGMHRKLLAAREAVCGGVGRVIVADGRLDGPVSAAVDGRGTVIAVRGE